MRAESVEAAGRGGMTPGAVLTAPAAGHVREAGERRLRRSPLAIVYLTVFIDLLGFSIILPLLPFYAERFGATGAWVGTLLTAYAAVQCVSAPLLGRLSDRVGRRPVLLLSLAGSAASLALTGVANSLVLLLAGRALAGLFGGSISTAQAYVADMTEPRERAKYMGLLGAAIGLGFVFGPAIGAGLAPLGFGAAAFAAAGLAAANLAFACLRLPESHGDRGWNRHTRASLASLLAGSRRSGAGRTLAGIFLATFAFVSLEATFALFSQQQFGLGPAGFGIVFTYLGLLIVCVQGGLVGRLSRRYEERALAAAGAAALCLAFVALAAAPGIGLALPALAALALGQGLLSPSLSALLSRESHAGEQGSMLGLGQAAGAAARAAGPIAAGWLFDVNRAAPYLVSAGLALAVAYLLSQTKAPMVAATAGESAPG
ncbi:MAG TPA: MFS transporter [Dehalococcoidia bacterium]|nr:MFS transporter [Dehalococcoidia bacterium]